MAELKITVGDAEASALVDGYVAAYRGPADESPRRKLRWFLRHLGRHVEDVAGEQAAAAAADAERERVREARRAMRFTQHGEAE